MSECAFCNVERATHFRVPTVYGIAEALCSGCYARYARVLHRAIETRPDEKPKRKSGANQLCFFFLENETSGPATAARFPESFNPLTPNSQEVNP